MPQTIERPKTVETTTEEVAAPKRTPKITDPVSELLLKAADVVDAGWTIGVLYDGAGNHCALGAIYYAFNEYESPWRQEFQAEPVRLAIWKLARTIGTEISSGVSDTLAIARWNNSLTNGAVVSAAMRKAAGR